jgi:hypothetical protein
MGVNPSPRNPRQPVRLGMHGPDYIFEKAVGLHENVMGLAVLPGNPRDPEVMLEEHGMGQMCA